MKTEKKKEITEGKIYSHFGNFAERAKICNSSSAGRNRMCGTHEL